MSSAMQFNITHQDLQKGLNAVSRLASGRMPLPILNNILIQAESNQLIFSVTDLELGIRVKLSAKVEKPGVFTAPAKLLTEFVQSTSDKQFTGSVSDNATLSLTSDHTGAKIRGLDASEFPGLPFTDDQPSFHLNTKDLKEAIDRVIYAAAIDETRPVLAGVYWYTDDTHLILAATDSYRLAEKRVKLASKPQKACSVIVPKKTLLELSRLLGDESGDISVFVGDNQIQFEWHNVRIVSRLIEGKYPPYQSIIPNGYQTRSTVHLGDFSSSLKIVSLFARDAGNLIKLNVVPGKGMTAQSLADQKGEATSQLTAIVEGDELVISFNVKYLLDAINAIQAENVFLEFSGAEKPLILRPANSKEYFSLVMPLKLD